VEARRPEDFYRAFADMTKARADALTVISTPLFDTERRRLVELAAARRLPAVYTFKPYVEAGGLMSYGPDVPDLFRRAATYVDKILKGAKPGDLPVEQPTKFDAINLGARLAAGERSVKKGGQRSGLLDTPITGGHLCRRPRRWLCGGRRRWHPWAPHRGSRRAARWRRTAGSRSTPATVSPCRASSATCTRRRCWGAAGREVEKLMDSP
jgi:hypothetical protein